MDIDELAVPDFRASLEGLLAGNEINSALLEGFTALSEAEVHEFLEGIAMLELSRRRALAQQLIEHSERDVKMDYVDLFSHLLGDGDARVREMAINGLWEHDRVQFIRPLIRLLNGDPDYGVRAAAATSLGRYLFKAECEELDERRAALVRDALLEAVRGGPDIEVQRRALESLAFLIEDWVMDLIELAYDHEDERMRQSSVFAMGRTAEPRWASIVLAELSSPELAMRFEAVRAAGELGLEAALDRLIALTEDLDGEVQEMAIWSLGQIGGKRAKEVLDYLLESGNEAQAIAAEAALDELEFAIRPMQMLVHEIDELASAHKHAAHMDDDELDDDDDTELDDELDIEDQDEDWPDEFLDLDEI